MNILNLSDPVGVVNPPRGTIPVAIPPSGKAPISGSNWPAFASEIPAAAGGLPPHDRVRQAVTLRNLFTQPQEAVK